MVNDDWCIVENLLGEFCSVMCYFCFFLEFPVSEKTLAHLLLDNEFESDILRVNMINSILILLLL